MPGKSRLNPPTCKTFAAAKEQTDLKRDSTQQSTDHACCVAAGNQFRITLREVTGASREQIEAAAAALKKSGFINYYGLQRFGNGSVPTHK